MNLVLNIVLLAFILYSFYCGIASIGKGIISLIRKVFKKDGKYIKCRSCGECDAGSQATGGQPGTFEKLD